MHGLVAALWVSLSAILEGVGLVLLIPILSVVFNAGSRQGWFDKITTSLFGMFPAETSFQKLSVLLAVFALLLVARGIVFMRRDMKLAQLRLGFIDEQQSRVMRRLAAASWGQIMALHHARITHLISRDTERLGIAVYFMLQTTVAAVILLIQCTLAILIAPGFGILTLVLLTATGLILFPLLRNAGDVGDLVTRSSVSLVNVAAQFMSGLKLAIAQNLQNNFITEFTSVQSELFREQLSFNHQQSYGRLVIVTGSALIGIIAILLGYGVFDVPAPDLITLLVIFTRMTGPALQIQQGAQQFTFCLPAYKNVEEIEDELKPISQTGADITVKRPEGPIVFHHVGFRHIRAGIDKAIPESLLDDANLHDINLLIEPGSFVGITGQSGAGKTTFADLLVGLLQPETGDISVGNSKLESDVATAWRDSIGYISQEPFLFHDTIRRNLLWAKPSASEQDIWHALTLVGAAGFVSKLPHGLETVVGDRGTLISGGERQRIALARAVLRQPRLLVLDEATNAIDIGGERELFDRLDRLKPRPTIVLIAHRLESLSRCERVLLLHNGKLIADGTFEGVTKLFLKKPLES